MQAWGAGGSNYQDHAGGAGAYIQATIPVTAGQVLTVVVGTTGGGVGFGARSMEVDSPGGGLVGVFSGAVTISSLSQETALLIAGRCAMNPCTRVPEIAQKYSAYMRFLCKHDICSMCMTCMPTWVFAWAGG